MGRTSLLKVTLVGAGEPVLLPDAIPISNPHKETPNAASKPFINRRFISKNLPSLARILGVSAHDHNRDALPLGFWTFNPLGPSTADILLSLPIELQSDCTSL